VLLHTSNTTSGLIINASLSINIASTSVIGMHLSPIPSVSLCVFVRKVYCGKTADWIQMPFGMVSEWVGRGEGDF